MNQISLSTELHLRLLEENDASEVFALVDANRERIGEWMPWVAGTRAVADSLAFIQTCTQDNQKGDHQFAIIYKEKIVGLIGLVRTDLNNKSSSIGYWIGEDCQGLGLVTQSVKAVLNFGFDTMEFNRIVIRAQPANTRSCAIPERLGFSLEGIAKEAEQLNGQFVDLRIYAMLRSQWQKNLT